MGLHTEPSPHGFELQGFKSWRINAQYKENLFKIDILNIDAYNAHIFDHGMDLHI